MTGQTAWLTFAQTHPAAAGHFPGNPMIPGALLLDAVIAAIAGDRVDAPMVIRGAKFLAIVRPGDSLAIRWRNLPDASVKFEGRVGDALAVSGALVFKAGS